MTRSKILLTLCALGLAACAKPPAAPSPAARTGLAAVHSADPQQLDLPTYERLTATVLAEALRSGDRETVSLFTAYAEHHDPQPKSSQAIARLALAETPAAASREAGDPLRSKLEAIAQGRLGPLHLTEQSQIRFPRDEGDHASALTEWWYLNGHLETKGLGPLKRQFGYEFTLFKVGPLLHWAHVAVSDLTLRRFHYVRQWIPARQALGSSEGLAQAYGPHRLRSLSDQRYALSSAFAEAGFDLQLTARKAPLLIGGNGKIDMPEGKDSWYYSQTRFNAQGTLTVGGTPQTVTGISWLDHQWGPFFVSGFADRWDWFSLQFDDGSDYNLFAFRDKQGNPGARHVNRSAVDGRGSVGSRYTMERLAWWQSPRTGLHYTTDWRITLPDTDETVELSARIKNQEVARLLPFMQDPLPHYWEGAMSATKRDRAGNQVKGRAYCEHFGLQKPEGPG
ncbi:MAG: lipocalin-like domain-containing protein [Candidatus Sericytochromatia bacterium]|nr:lipocalin-like domain-containing protein [Candidatus Sericytochromatia bacterium]